MSGRVLTSSAIVDIVTNRSGYGRALLVAAVELGMTFPTPSTALLQAWAAVPPEARALLELFLDAPAIVVEDLGASVAAQAGVRAHPAQQTGGVDVAGPRGGGGDRPRVGHPDRRTWPAARDRPGCRDRGAARSVEPRQRRGAVHQVRRLTAIRGPLSCRGSSAAR